MSGDLDLEQRYRRVLRLLPDYYRDQWEDDMVAAFLDGWLTGDPDEDSVSMEFDRPTRPEMASVVGLAARLYLGGAVAPLRRFAWGQAVRSTVLAVMLFHAMRGLGALVVLDGSRRGWLPAPAPGIWTTVWYAVGYVWIAVFVALVLGYYREARVLAVLAIVPDLVVVVQMQLTGALQSPSGSWASWILLDLAPVLAKAALPPGRPAGRPLALAAGTAGRLPAGVRAAAGHRDDHSPGLAAGPSRAVLHPGHSPVPGPRAESLVRPGRHGHVVAGPVAARCRRRSVPDRLAGRLPGPAPDPRGPGGTAHPAGRRRAGRPGRRPCP
jgi:hypothetical protein